MKQAAARAGVVLALVLAAAAMLGFSIWLIASIPAGSTGMNPRGVVLTEVEAGT